ncbi:MAG: transcriptional regulator [Verrucomicrobiaceae bacterium]|nr:transcriptional regulator [Verrucomicrobiaceae bacterium]
MSDLSLRQRAYDHLQQKLISGELHPGSVVSEQSLASEIGMSRTPMREAIRTLEQEGVLEQLPRFGTRVRTLERRDLEELYELREAMEPFAVAKAAMAAFPEDVLSLRRVCDEIHTLAAELRKSKVPSLDAAQMQRLLGADLGFHLMLLRVAGNHRMMKIVSDSRLLTGIFGTQRQAHTAQVLEQTHREHTAILEAVERGNGKAAANAMTQHIRASKQQALEAYDRQQSQRNPRLIPLAMPQQLLAEIDRIEARRPTSRKASK